MLEDILKLEREAFLFCNGSDYLFLDRFMWLYSGKMVWYPLAAFILFLLIYKKNWKEILLVVLGIVLVITLCDQFASHVCKPMFTQYILFLILYPVLFQVLFSDIWYIKYM
ncbi:MAG: hypothetical protein LUE98_14645 [Tannerellaceae bacterium]|nr:hypothetical protein [Tannerellaceae bacterium]